jgi:GNAT superfamily N-acetyltransferase
MKIARDDSEAVAKAVEDGLSAFNRANAGSAAPVPVQIALRDDDGVLKGGVVARVWLDTLYVALVWIDETLRGKGHGKTMMEMVEAEGRKHGATQVWLNTLSWQARPFYEQLGYVCFGEVPVAGGTHRRYFLQKAL